jgi:hypothetical protein
VALLEDMLFVELEKVVDGWLWHSDMIGNKPGLGLGCFGGEYCWWWRILWMVGYGMRRVGWQILLVVGSPLHSVVDFFECHLL